MSRARLAQLEHHASRLAQNGFDGDDDIGNRDALGRVVAQLARAAGRHGDGRH